MDEFSGLGCSQKVTNDDNTPKNDDVIYEQPLTKNILMVLHPYKKEHLDGSHFSLPGRILSPSGLPVTGSSSNLDFTMMVKTICKDRREKEEGLEEEEGMLG